MSLDQTTEEVTILLPNHKTIDFTKFCMLRIRKHTDFDLANIIVH